MKSVYALYITTIISVVTHAQQIWRSELLGRPTDSSVVVKLFFADSAEVKADYGTISGSYTGHTNWQLVADSEATVLTLSGLQPDTRYYYRIQYRNPGSSSANNRPEGLFHTARKPGSAYVFTVQADPHVDPNSDTALYRRCLQNQLQDQADFMIDLGDFLMTDKLKNASNIIPRDTIVYRSRLLRSFYEISGHSLPLFIANGNHEGEAGWYLNNTPDNIAVWDGLERKKYFCNPVPDHFYSGDTSTSMYIGKRESFYSWEWGDALFVVLDPYWYTMTKPDSLNGWRWTLGDQQYHWLENVLQQSHATFKFVFAHQLVGGDPQGRGGVEFADYYEWGGKNLDGSPGFTQNRPGWAKPIKDLLTANRVNIFFHGHDHFFGQQSKDCLLYQETPQPSLPNFSYPSQAAQYGYHDGWFVGNSGHLRISVSDAEVKVEYIRAYLPADTNATHHNRDVAATYYIRKVNCYDSLQTGSPVLWNSDYFSQLAFPNPFQQQTFIQFNLPDAEKVWLDITDAQGRLVRHLIDGFSAPEGATTVIWDGNNDAGSPAPSGIYNYRLNAIHHQSSGTLLLTR
ncbi:MAG: FlgD immunoglobulin-like domain containing protein [Chitinophagales bacterium]